MPYLIIGPSLALFLFVLSANLVGDTLQETLNPKLKGRRQTMMGLSRFGTKKSG